MCKFIRKSNEWIFCKLSKSELLRLYSIVYVAMETTKMSNFTCQSKSIINIFSTCQVSACKLQPFSCHNLANDIYSETAKTVFSHLNSLFPTLLPRFAHTFRAPRVVFAGPLVGKSIAIFFVLLTHQNSILSTLGWLLGAICRVPFAFFWGAAGRYWDTFFNWSPAG